MAIEQLELDIALTPKQVVFLHAMDEEREILFGGGRGGGKSHGLRAVFLIRRIRYPGSAAAIWRRTYAELERNHIRPLFTEFPQLREYYNEGRRLLSLPNGSTLEFCYAESRRYLAKVQGAECDDLGLEEAGDWHEDEFEILLATNRSTDHSPRAACTANPGGIGHAWLRKRFVTNPAPGRRYIPALLTDNPALLTNNPDYRRVLEEIKNPVLRKAWLEGDWNITAGQFFESISDSVHFIDPFPVPEHWPRWGAYDYGFNHPAAWGWETADGDGNVYTYRELVQAKLDIPEQAALVKAEPSTKKISVWHAGHDCWAKKSGNDPTIAEKFATHGIYLVRANIDRIQGAAQMRAYLQHKMEAGKRIGPRWFIFKTCPVTFDAVSRMVHDPNRVEDVLKVDAVDGDPYTGDDAYDRARYSLMSRPPIAIAPRKAKLDRYGRKAPESLPWSVA